MKLFLVDTETTDLPENDPHAEIVEIGWGYFDTDTRRLMAPMSILVKHTRPLGEFTAKAFGGVDFSRAYDLDLAIGRFVEAWRKSQAAWTGQNPSFDLGFLKRAAHSCGLSWPRAGKVGTDPLAEVDYHTLDLASMIAPLVWRGDLPGFGLAHSRLWAGCTGEQSHRARGDVEDMAAVLQKILEYPPPESDCDFCSGSCPRCVRDIAGEIQRQEDRFRAFDKDLAKRGEAMRRFGGG